MPLTSPPPWDDELDGRFPFGRPNTPRPAREPESGIVRQLVLGVYPSALHVSWTRPASSHLTTRQRRVASMAVDVEPVVFWCGGDADERVAAWREQVGFREGDTADDHGLLAPATNGPSGVELDSYFDGLSLPRADTAFADVYPVYLVKRRGAGSDGKRREQGDAIDEVYGGAVSSLAPGADGPWLPASLPTRFTSSRLPHEAATRFGSWLLSLLSLETLVSVVTLGQEPWSTLALLEGIDVAPPAVSLSATRTAGYGRSGSLTIDGRKITWTPLAHPGLLRQSDSKVPGSWSSVHDAWRTRAS